MVSTLIIASALSAWTPASLEPGRNQQACSILHFSEDGRRSAITPGHPSYAEFREAASRAQASNGRAFASSSGSSSSSSAVSVSSNSLADRSSSSATITDRNGRRSITTTQDQTGCTVVIDERPAPRSNP